MMKKMKSHSLAASMVLVLATMTSTMAAERTLSAEEAKKLISGNTVRVTQTNNGKQWSIFFAADGKGYESKDKVSGTWEIKDDGKHCVTWAKLKCATIVDIGDGKFARVKDNGYQAVIWTIEEGNKL